MPTSARDVYDTAPLGALVAFTDHTRKPPARHRLKLRDWERSNRSGRLVKRTPATAFSSASFTLHIGDYGSNGITVVSFFEDVSVTSPLLFTVTDSPPRGSFRVATHDDNGIVSWLHTAPDRAEAEARLQAYPTFSASVEPADTPDALILTYLQDPAHGWLIVSDADLARFGFSRADFSRCSYVSRERIALEEDCDMPRFLKRLDEQHLTYRLVERFSNADAPVRQWASNVPEALPA